MPITTTNYVDIHLRSSSYLIAALSSLYLSVGSLLIIFAPVILFPISYLFCEALFFEWGRAYQHCYVYQGPLRLHYGGSFQWYSQQGNIVKVKLITRWLVVFKIEHTTSRWLIICHDSCDDAVYRHLTMLAHLGIFTPTLENDN